MKLKPLKNIIKFHSHDGMKTLFFVIGKQIIDKCPVAVNILKIVKNLKVMRFDTF